MKKRLRFEVVVRVVADILLLNVSIVIGVLVRWLLMGNSGEFAPWKAFWWMSLCVSIPGPIMFGLWGFYTRGRFYESRYKAVTIIQAIGVLFLAFGFVNYLIMGHSLSRLVTVACWIAATGLLLAARLWASLWRVVVEREQLLSQRRTVDEHRVLLIGGAGYIGSGLLPLLLERGYKVRLLDAFIYGEEPIRCWMNHPNLEVIDADFRNIQDVVCAMREVGTVIHLGAIVGDPACALDEELSVDVNLLATRTIAEIAKGNGVRRFIFASTCSVYGASDELLNEHSMLNPVSLYARSKIACEHMLASLGDRHFLPVILRFGTIYGLSGRTRFDLVVNLLAAKALIDGKITVFGKDQWRPFVHVQDAARAVLTVLEARSEQLAEPLFNVGSDEQNFTLGDVGETIKRMVPAAELICTEGDSDRRNYRVDFSRIRKTLRFQPKWHLEDGIQQVLDAVTGGSVVDYRDPKYSNVKFLGEENHLEALKRNGRWAEDLLREGAERPLAIAYAAKAR